MIDALTRRDFLKTTALFSTLGLAPQFLTRTVEATAQIKGFPDDRVLVVVQLGGGNDGLNTVVPVDDDHYHRARPQLALPSNRLIRINDEIALNDAAAGLARLFDDGQLAIVQGVGYPNPDRSHFRSMEIWHTASDSDQHESSGWLGRYFDHCCEGTPVPHAGVALSVERPQAFESLQGLGIAFTSPDRFGWRATTHTDTESAFMRLNSGASDHDTVDFLRHVAANAVTSSHEVRRAIDNTGFQLRGGNILERDFETIAAMIKGELNTRIYFVDVSGFDTHANQRGQHDRLLRMVGDALNDFQRRLTRDGTSGRVVTMVFSEFGRRVSQNQSGGTDHGTANPMFLIGDCVRRGAVGAAPDLSDLVDGDLKHTIDFRTVYATLLNDWFQSEPTPILNGDFGTIPLIRSV